MIKNKTVNGHKLRYRSVFHLVDAFKLTINKKVCCAPTALYIQYKINGIPINTISSARQERICWRQTQTSNFILNVRVTIYWGKRSNVNRNWQKRKLADTQASISVRWYRYVRLMRKCVYVIFSIGSTNSTRLSQASCESAHKWELWYCDPKRLQSSAEKYISACSPIYSFFYGKKEQAIWCISAIGWNFSKTLQNNTIHI